MPSQRSAALPKGWPKHIKSVALIIVAASQQRSEIGGSVLG